MRLPVRLLLWDFSVAADNEPKLCCIHRHLAWCRDRNCVIGFECERVVWCVNRNVTNRENAGCEFFRFALEEPFLLLAFNHQAELCVVCGEKIVRAVAEHVANILNGDHVSFVSARDGVLIVAADLE